MVLTLVYAWYTFPFMVNTAIAYLRVSTDEQHLGPVAQRSAIEAFCAREGLTVTAWHVDHGVSGAAALDKRPALMAAVDNLTPGAVLIVSSRDRLARDTMAAAMIERLAVRAGASIVAASGAGNGDSPEALLMRRMMDAFAEYERALIRARTTRALAVKKSRGERVGQIPFGFTLADDGVTLTAQPEEQKAMEVIAALRSEGLSVRAITETLNAAYKTAARGKKWHATTVTRLLKKAAA